MTRRQQLNRVVIDTNLIISALVFSQGKPAMLRRAWQHELFQPLISKATATELIRALNYPKFKLASHEQNELLADYLPWCQSVVIPNPAPKTPACKDVFARKTRDYGTAWRVLRLPSTTDDDSSLS